MRPTKIPDSCWLACVFFLLISVATVRTVDRDEDKDFRFISYQGKSPHMVATSASPSSDAVPYVHGKPPIPNRVPTVNSNERARGIRHERLRCDVIVFCRQHRAPLQLAVCRWPCLAQNIDEIWGAYFWYSTAATIHSINSIIVLRAHVPFLCVRHRRLVPTHSALFVHVYRLRAIALIIITRKKKEVVNSWYVEETNATASPSESLLHSDCLICEWH